jgi:hypothetical protein
MLPLSKEQPRHDRQRRAWRLHLGVADVIVDLGTLDIGPCMLELVLLQIQGLGFKDPTLWPFFAGERKSGSSRQGFESLLPGKKHPKLREISQIWATFGTKKLFAVFGAFWRIYPFGVNCTYFYGSFLWNLGIRILKIRIGLKAFF